MKLLGNIMTSRWAIVVLGVVMIGLLAAGAAGGFWASEHDAIAKIRERWIAPLLDTVDGDNDESIPWHDIDTNLHRLQTATITLSTNGVPVVWALAPVGNNIVFSSRLGQISYLNSANHFEPLNLQVPMNIDALRQSEVFRNPTFQVSEFRTLDLLAVRTGPVSYDLYASHHSYNPDGSCFNVAVHRAQLTFDGDTVSAASQNWEQIYVARPCIAPKDIGMPLAGHEGGGRLALLDPNTLLLSVGVHQFDGVRGPEALGQDPETDLGKIIAIDITARTGRIFAMGVRNPQGLLIARDGRIWETEHGPKGGDEVNLIHDGGNYGWPVVTYGMEYGSPPRNWPFNPNPGAHDGFEHPRFAFVPSVGISNLIEPDPREFPLWNNHLLAASLRENALYLLRLEGDNIVYAEPILFASRLRDIISLPDGRIAIATDIGIGGPSALILVRNAEMHEVNDLSMTVSGVENLPGPLPEEVFADVAPEVLGQQLFQNSCATCHSTIGEIGIGPPLNGVIGRRVGSAQGFGYSRALMNRPERWTEARLRSFITEPERRYPGTVMPRFTIPDHYVAAIVTYLETTEETPAEPPAAAPEDNPR